MKLELYEGEMHQSLSRPFALRQMQITPFAESLRDVCSEKAYCACNLLMLQHAYGNSFYLELDGWQYFVNDERTRSFFALTVKAGKPQVSLVSVRLLTR